MTPKQMRRIADVAENYGSGEIRLTVWQNLIIPNVPDHFVETVKKNLVKMGFHHHSATAISGGLIACTGNTGCKWAATNTKGQAVLLARHLQKKLQLDQPINIHLTGCPNSCAQHYIGDIGLLGAKVIKVAIQSKVTTWSSVAVSEKNKLSRGKFFEESRLTSCPHCWSMC